jgi:hypothetical protein
VRGRVGKWCKTSVLKSALTAPQTTRGRGLTCDVTCATDDAG